jgi:hypothetical protein
LKESGWTSDVINYSNDVYLAVLKTNHLPKSDAFFMFGENTIIDNESYMLLYDVENQAMFGFPSEETAKIVHDWWLSKQDEWHKVFSSRNNGPHDKGQERSIN